MQADRKLFHFSKVSYGILIMRAPQRVHDDNTYYLFGLYESHWIKEF